MAIGTITLSQKPVSSVLQTGLGQNNFTPIFGYTLLQDDISGLFNFKLILEVRENDSSGTLLAKIKQRRNGYSPDVAGDQARAVFDLKDIVNDTLCTTLYDQNDSGTPPYRSIHTIGSNTPAKPFSTSGDLLKKKYQVGKIYVKGYQEYATTEGGEITENTSVYAEDTVYVIRSSRDLFSKRSLGAGYIQNNGVTLYLSSGRQFMTDVPFGQSLSGEQYLFGWYIRNIVKEDDYHTIAFMNDGNLWTLTPGLVPRIKITYYDADENVIPSAGLDYIENNATNGGLDPAGTVTNKGRLIYFGVGPKNLEEQSVNTDLRPSAYSGWIYYKVEGQMSSGTLTTIYAVYFVKDQTCTKYKTRRLAWRNSFGTWDYYNFTMKNVETVEVNRQNYNSMLGNFNDTHYYYNNLDTGTATAKVNAKVKEVLQSDWVVPDYQDPDNIGAVGGYPISYSTVMQSLFLSDEVYIIENSDTPYSVPVIITDKTFVRKTKQNDNTFQYTVNIEYANPLNTNS